MMSTFHVEHRRRETQKTKTKPTCGVAASVWSCGIIFGLTELYGSESKTQVFLFLLRVFDLVEQFPKYIAYDDACHLSKFVNARGEWNNLTRALALVIFMCDRLHYKKHTDPWCKKNMNRLTINL
eukprot:Lithocolla_globosa_v1_NODE_11172_length_529_cov_36.339662.p1 type:complete len:125 gc:universal NODE_11172_length_529_cov_36.339662:97-471(+)